MCHFRGNEVLTERISRLGKTAKSNAENRTALSQIDLIVSSFEKCDFSEIEQKTYEHCAKLQFAIYA